MTDWWSYGPSDLLLFSPRVYFRMFELHNRAVWPAPILTMALGIALLLLLLRRAWAAGWIVPGVLGALWIWIAWAFLWQRYATINWAAAYIAPAFVLEGSALLWLAARRDGLSALARDQAKPARMAALVLFAAAVILYPLLAALLGRPWRAAEVFGVAPDPTAIATLAALALAPGRMRWPLAVLPALWCGFSGATLWAMDARGSVVPAGAALLVFALPFVAGRLLLRDPRPPS